MTTKCSIILLNSFMCLTSKSVFFSSLDSALKVVKLTIDYISFPMLIQKHATKTFQNIFNRVPFIIFSTFQECIALLKRLFRHTLFWSRQKRTILNYKIREFFLPVFNRKPQSKVLIVLSASIVLFRDRCFLSPPFLFFAMFSVPESDLLH